MRHSLFTFTDVELSGLVYTRFICTFIEARSVGVDGLVALYLVREVLVYV